jgi:signal transduction histidine kinase
MILGGTTMGVEHRYVSRRMWKRGPPPYRDPVRRGLPRALLDVGGSLLFVAFLMLATAHIPPGDGDRSLDAVGYGTLALAGGSLSLARRKPWITVCAVTAALAVYIGRTYAGGPIFATGWIAFFSLGYHVRRRDAVVAAATLSGILVVVGAVAGRSEPLLHLMFLGWSAAAVFLGDALRSRRQYLAELEERHRNLERTREEETRRGIAEERLRIAQDLHDTVAHAMATINVQAGAAAHVVDRRPESAREALTVIQRASGDVLDELSALLNLLRDPVAPGERAPTPGLERVPDLVATTEQAGLAIELTVTGPVDAVSPALSTAAFRIVQESLTNVVRHSGSVRAGVRIDVADGRLAVEVVDEGTVTAGGNNGTGRGIQGMRERAEATGGELHAGARPEGGFRVRATWPGRP